MKPPFDFPLERLNAVLTRLIKLYYEDVLENKKNVSCFPAWDPLLKQKKRLLDRETSKEEKKASEGAADLFSLFRQLLLLLASTK